VTIDTSNLEERDSVHVCVIWEIVPEETKVYAFDVNRATAEWMRKAHTTYGNTDTENEHTKNLSAFLESREPVEGVVEQVDIVIVSGFVL
jgi:hypothetical protein